MTSSPSTARRWPDIPAPIAPRQPLTIQQLGRTRTDPYAWMRFIPPSGSRILGQLPSPLNEHLEAEMAYAQAILEPLADSTEAFYQHMAEKVPETQDPLPPLNEGWSFHADRPAGHAHRIFYRTSPEGVTQPLFDEADRASGHAYYRATDHQLSPDNRYFSWAEDIVGDDRHRLCILDTDSGIVRTVVQTDAFGYGGFTFSPSSRYLFWIWRDAHSRPTRLYRSPVNGGEAVLIYEEHDPALFMQVARTAADGYVALTLAGPDMSEVHLISASAETATPQVLRPRQRGIRYEVNEWNNALLMLTDADGALDRKLLSLDPSSFSVQGELVPHRPGTPILLVQPFRKALVRLERQQGLPQVVIRSPSGQETVIKFDEAAYSLQLIPGQVYDARQVRMIHQTPAQPPRTLDADLDSGSCQRVAQVRLHGFDPSQYQVERLHAQAADGASIPITVLSRTGASPDTPLPLLLTGYGAYGIAFEPRFSLPATALVDAGFRYAIAHVRGGSEQGRHWYQDGCRQQKRNSMTDFIACARHLLDNGYAAPGQIVAQGVSAGGLLVCGAMNSEPELWAGVIAQVPFVDMLNTMSDANHPLVPLLRPDWGDPLADPEAYDAMLGISPYENVHEANYPPLLCTAGLKDDRVPYWEPAKLIAAIRHLATGGNPAVLMLDPDSGHQQSDDRNSEFAQAALFWAFARHCVSAA